jgi:hypothetical protein
MLIEHHVVSKVPLRLFCSLTILSIDFHAGEWQVNSETEKRERLCTYKVTVAAVFGSTTICSNERQVKKSIFSFNFSMNYFINRLLIVNYPNHIISSIPKYEMKG